MFVKKWKEAEISGSYILNEKAKKELEALRSHSIKGCLSDIPVQAGTNRNENLHRFINPYFRRCRMGIPLALALLTILFHHNNKKHSDIVSVLSSKASYLKQHIDKSHNVQFGIMGKTQAIPEDSWILAKRGGLHESTPTANAAKLQITPDLEEFMDIHELLETLQSALNLHQLCNTLCDLSNHSPLLDQKMLPFMSSVSCLFLTVDSDNAQHQQCLNNVVQSWGFQIEHTAGDGNCCFAALAFTLCSQHQQIESALPSFFSDVAIDIHTEITDIAYKLRQLAVNEWMKHPSEYQNFLDGNYTVADEAPQFLQQGYFYGPLGNTMVLAISNALGLPIIVFSSAYHYPVINIIPRVCKASIPLYVAFNQSGAGHYDAVSIPATSMSLKKFTTTECPFKCTCGKRKKQCSTTKHCSIIQFKYTTSIRCPCHLASRPCTSRCECSHCANPNGIKPKVGSKRERDRRNHSWNNTQVKSARYAYLEKERIATGPRTQLEYLLVSQILAFLQKHHIDQDVHVVHKIYMACLELCQGPLPLSEKTTAEVEKIVREYHSHRKVFVATCIAELKISSSGN